MWRKHIQWPLCASILFLMPLGLRTVAGEVPGTSHAMKSPPHTMIDFSKPFPSPPVPSDGDYDKRWQEVKRNIDKGLPQSAVEQTRAIYALAEQRDDFGQLVKAGLTLMALRQDVSADSAAVDVADVEARLAAENAVERKALLRTLLASVYADLAVSRLTWSDEEAKSQFQARRDEHVRAVLADLRPLADIQAQPYAPLYAKGRDSRLYGDDILSLVARFIATQGLLGTEPLWRMQLRVADIYREQGKRDACVLARLSALDTQQRLENRRLRLTRAAYLETLKELYNANADTEAGSDACLAYLRADPEISQSQRADIARMAQRQWPSSPLKKAFRHCEEGAHAPSLSLSTPRPPQPNAPFAVAVSHRNLSGAQVRVTDKRTKKVVATQSLAFDHFRQRPDVAEDMQRDTFQLTLPPGDFHVEVRSRNCSDTTSVHLTTLRVFALHLPGNRRVLCVVDNVTGRPVAGCKVVGQWEDYADGQWKKHSATYRTDAEGRVEVDESPTAFRAYLTDGDVSHKCVSYFSLSAPSAREKADLKYAAFTDRAIYRPGQTLHAAGILYSQLGDETRVAPDTEVTFTLRDANRQVVEKKQARTDAYGKAAADFTLPTDRLNGTYSLAFGAGSVTFRVEEYKRPTFAVEFDPVDGQFSLGDSIELVGVAKTFSGVPVQGASVAWRVRARPASFWDWWHNASGWETCGQGTATTGDDGRFRVMVHLDGSRVGDDEAPGFEWDGAQGMMVFQLNADITDLAGETQPAEKTLRVANADFGLRTDIPASVERTGQPCVKVLAQNANGQPVDAEGTWRLCRYAPGAADDYATCVAEGTFSTARHLDLGSLASLPLGSYRLSLAARDSRQRAVADSVDFVLWSREGGAMALSDDWLHAPSATYSPSRGVEAWFAPQCADAYTYVYLVSDSCVIDDRAGLRAGSLERMAYDYDARFGSGMELFVTYVRDGQLHTVRRQFTLEKPAKQLRLTWATFRDRLAPGQQETWTLHVAGADGKPADAQLLATMYDGSLDQLAPFTQSFAVGFSRPVPRVGCHASDDNPSFFLSPNFKVSYTRDVSRTFSSLRPYADYAQASLPRFGKALLLTEACALNDAAPSAMQLSARVRGVARGAAAEEEEDTADAPAAGEGGTEQPAAAAPLRSNFAETAFFMPALHTDAQGNVRIAFTLPESMTEWKFAATAHTRAVDYGSLRATATARKDIMVQPNMPRFVRTGDRLSLTARIVNQSDRHLAGTAVMRLIDPRTGRVAHSQKHAFAVEAGKTTAATFDYAVGDEFPMLVCEVEAGNAAVSDGERNWLPVLTDRKHVVETVPFYIEGGAAKTIDLSALFNNRSETATRRAMTFEYTDNPSWSAVLAMHALLNPERDDALSHSAALYVNSVARSIAQRVPSLRQLIQRWNAEEAGGGTLTSELQKNEELKEILLKETPWMLDAQDETEQRKQLAELFDDRLIDARTGAAVAKLERLQRGSGAWTWFEGMEDNYYVTLAVTEHLARLADYQRAQGQSPDAAVASMLRKAFRYLDARELDYYEKHARRHPQWLPGESTFRWMYAAHQARHTFDRKTEAAKNDYLDRTQGRVADLTMFGRAKVAEVLLADGRKKQGAAFVRSLREYTVARPGDGRFFDTERARYSWMDYRLPTHIAAMRAFRASAADSAVWNDGRGTAADYLNAMQLWMLRQKQTQKWDNAINTLEAVDLLLKVAPDVAFRREESPVVRLGDRPLELPEPTAGMGYVKAAVPDKLLDARTAEVAKTGAGTSWGCFYGQCEDRLDRLAASGQSLTVVRKFYVQTAADGSADWREMADGETLRVGDKVRMRHVVTADRDLDFVQVRSQHAACFEPLRQRSGYQWMGGRGCYLSLHDASADFFFDTFHKGTATIDLDMYVTRAGRYSNGIATAQCAYAPAYAGHSAGEHVVVE